MRTGQNLRYLTPSAYIGTCASFAGQNISIWLLSGFYFIYFRFFLFFLFLSPGVFSPVAALLLASCFTLPILSLSALFHLFLSNAFPVYISWVSLLSLSLLL